MGKLDPEGADLDNHRGRDRYPLQEPGQVIRADGVALSVTVADVSNGGAGLLTRHALPQHSRIQLLMEVELGGCRYHVETRGRVRYAVWIGPVGVRRIGVSFDGFSNGSRVQLLDLLDYLAGLK